MRFDGAGALLWAREERLFPTGNSEDYWEWATDVAALPDGCYLVGQTNRGGLTQWAARLDGSGSTAWARICTDGGFALTWDVGPACVARDGGLLVAGTTGSGAGAGMFDGYVLKYTAGGDASWATAFGGTKDDSLWALALPTNDAGILAGGGTVSFRSDGERDAWMLRLTETGTVFFTPASGGVATSLSGTAATANLNASAFAAASETPETDLESLSTEHNDWTNTVNVISQTN
jgi:hypothetical protein